MKREKLIFVVVFVVCSFLGGRVFAGYYHLEGSTYSVADVVDCGLNDTIGTGDYAYGLDVGDSVGYRLDSSLGPLARHDEWMIGDDTYILESGFYQINYDAAIENPTFVFNDSEIGTTTIRFKLESDINPDWTQYAIAFSTAVTSSDLFTGTTFYIDKNGDTVTSWNPNEDWNPASFYEGIELTGLNPNTIYGFKIKSKSPPPELISTDWSGNTDNYTWTHIETPGISVKVYITSATVTAEGTFTNLGEGASGIDFGIGGSWENVWGIETSYAFTGLTHNTLYPFEVKARNGKPYETGVDSISECTLCGPPESPYIINVSSYSLTLGWSHSSLGAPDHYYIKENEEPIQDNYTLLSLDRTSLENVNFRYIYKIYAVNTDDEYDEISSVSISTYTFCSIPPAPQIVDVSANTVEIVIDEGDNPWYTEYSIKVSGGGTDSFVQIDYTVGGSEVFQKIDGWGSPLTISTLLSNVEYDISVKAMNKYGHVTDYGASVSSCTYAIVPGLDIEENKVAGWMRIYIQERNNSLETEYAIWVEEKGGGPWAEREYLQSTKTTSSNPCWQTKAGWEEGDGFIEILGWDLENFGYRFKAKARRTIEGYSEEETGWSSYVYAGQGIQTPIARIDSVELSAGTTVYYNIDKDITFTATGAEIRYTYTTDGSTLADPILSDSGGLSPISLTLTASDGESKTYKIKAKAWKVPLQSDVGGVWIVVIDKDAPEISSFSIAEAPVTQSREITLEEISATGADEMYIYGDVEYFPTWEWIDYRSSEGVRLAGESGDKTVYIKVRDKAGNESDPVNPVSCDIKFDKDPPWVDSVSINEGDLTNSPTIQFTIVATNADYMLIDGDVIEEDGVTKEWIGFSSSKQVILTSGDGEKTVTVKVANIIGTESVPKSDIITLDTIVQNPTLILSDQDSGNQDYTNARTVDVSMPDLDTDVEYYILSETQSERPDVGAATWSFVRPETFELSSAEGLKRVYLWVKDAAENINVGISSATITLDTQGPEIDSLSIEEGDYTNSEFINLTSSATGADYMWIGGDVTDIPSDWISYSPSTGVTLVSGDGPKTVTIKFKDEAGNETPQSPDPPKECTITLDKTSPVVDSIEAWLKDYDIKLEESEVNTCHNPKFKLDASDNLSGVKGYSYTFSTNPDLDPDNDIDITTDSILLELTTSDTDGTYYFKVKAMDNAGNFSGVKPFAYKYKADWGAPEATIDVEGKETMGNEVIGVERSILPEILFNEEVLGVQNNVEVELIRDNEGKDISGNVSCAINDEGEGLWKIDPGKDWGSNYTYRITVTTYGIVDKAYNTLKEEKELIFTTMLDHTKKNVVMLESDKKTKMILEANALKEDGYILINLEPLPLKKTGGAIETKQVNTEAIIEADEKMKRSGDRYCYNLRESMRETSGYTTEGGEMVIDRFLNSVYIELPYEDGNNNGIVDSTEDTSEPVSEGTLSVYWLDEEHRLWVKVPGTKVDRKQNVARAKVTGFGVYTLMGGSFYDLSLAKAYPVPYKPNDGLPETGDKTSGITFTGLSSEGEIKIYTITGELVKKLTYKNDLVKKWDVKNEKGEKVVSGVYIYYLTNNKQHKSGKLVIIR